MRFLSSFVLVCFFVFGGMSSSGFAKDTQKKIHVVATFSLLEDMVRQIAGDRVETIALVGPESDAHVFEPSPQDLASLQKADLVVMNGLGFEPWADRLLKGRKRSVLVASRGVRARILEDSSSSHGHAAHQHETQDPHAWQDLKNAMLYVQNIRDALEAKDPENKAFYRASAESYLMEIKTLHQKIQKEMQAIPEKKRKVISNHDAFGYFAQAYGVEFLAAEGLSTEAEPTPERLRTLIDQLKKESVKVVFLENISDSRIMAMLAQDTGVKVGGTLYSDALSKKGGMAPTYLEMMAVNAKTLISGLQ